MKEQQVTTYICELCDARYSDKADAELCEESCGKRELYEKRAKEQREAEIKRRAEMCLRGEHDWEYSTNDYGSPYISRICCHCSASEGVDPTDEALNKAWPILKGE